MKKIIALLLAFAVLFAAGCSQDKNVNNGIAPASTSSGTAVDLSGITDASSAAAALQAAVMDGTDAHIQTAAADFSDRDFSGEYYTNVTEIDLNALTDNYEITSEGTYVFTGTMKNHQIRVNLADKDKAQIVLNNAHITSADGPAIYILAGDKTFITLAEGTENTLTDTVNYTLEDGDEPNACLFSKSDLTVNGTGRLTIIGNYNHGIYSKDDLSLVSGTLNVTAVNDAIKGKDFVQVASGTYNLTAGSDGLVSNNADSADVGYIVIQGGEFNIHANNDGIQAETLLQIENGSFDITSGGGSANASYTVEGEFNQGWGNWQSGGMPQDGGFGGFGGQGGFGGFSDGGQRPDRSMSDGAMPGMTPPNGGMPNWGMSDGSMPGMTPPNENGNTPTGIPQGDANFLSTNMITEATASAADSTTVSDSAKGLKAGTALLITGGTFTLDTSDDCLHSNGDIGITGGIFTMASGDDGVHADDAAVILAGTFSLSRSYEGIEGNSITVAGGAFDLTAADDGFNAAGGNDNSAANGRPGMGGFDTSTSSYLRFTGGEITLDASGDGLDSNGYLYVEGGNIYLSGPTNSGNGAMDYGIEGTISGGIVALTGASGMAQNFSNSSTQCVFLVNFDRSVAGGEKLIVTDSAGKEILSFTPQKSYQCAVVSSPELTQGETYTVTAGTASMQVTLNAVVTGGGGGMMGGFGGWK